jgi:hypothetical protein
LHAQVTAVGTAGGGSGTAGGGRRVQVAVPASRAEPTTTATSEGTLNVMTDGAGELMGRHLTPGPGQPFLAIGAAFRKRRRVLVPVLLLAVSASPLRLAAPGFTCEGVSPTLCAAYVERFSTLLGSERVKVTTAGDVTATLGLERQRQLLGCTDSGCMAELAGALGVDGLLLGTVVKTSASWLVTLKVVRPRDGSVWVQASARAKSEDELQAFLDATAVQFRDAVSPAPVVAPTAWVRWLPAIAGGVSLLAGVGLFTWAKVDAGTLADLKGTVLKPSDVVTIAGRGSVNEKLGLVFGSVGLGAILASVLWVTLGGPVQVSAVVSPGVGGVSVRGDW